MRKLVEVIDRMAVHVPSYEISLTQKLLAIKTSASYAPPELDSYWWNKCADVLIDFIPEPQQGWEFEVAKIFNGVE